MVQRAQVGACGQGSPVRTRPSNTTGEAGCDPSELLVSEITMTSGISIFLNSAMMAAAFVRMFCAVRPFIGGRGGE